MMILLACLLAGGLLFWSLWDEEISRFEVKFPPISDAEFLRRCPPGSNPETALRVRSIVSEVLGVEYARIHPECRFIEDLGAD